MDAASATGREASLCKIVVEPRRCAGEPATSKAAGEDAAQLERDVAAARRCLCTMLVVLTVANACVAIAAVRGAADLTAAVDTFAVRFSCSPPPNFIDPKGYSWGARDASILVTGGFATAPPGTVIANAGGLDTVFLSECSGSMAMSLPAPVDTHYDVTLLAAETHWSSPGQRVFDVLFDGRIVLRHIDLVALVGANAAWQTTIARVPVSGGRLNITFQNVVDQAKLGGVMMLLSPA